MESDPQLQEYRRRMEARNAVQSMEVTGMQSPLLVAPGNSPSSPDVKDKCCGLKTQTVVLATAGLLAVCILAGTAVRFWAY